MIDGNTTIGEICHITAASPNGLRFDETMTDDNRRSEKNLILLCPSCHKKIDNEANIKDYPADILKQWKQAHKAKFSGTEIPVSDKIAEEARAELLEYLDRIEKKVSKIKETTDNIEETTYRIDDTSLEILDTVNHTDQLIGLVVQRLLKNEFSLVHKDSTYALDINTVEFIEGYTKDLIEDAGLFQGVGINNLYEEDELLYIEPQFSERQLSREQLIISKDNYWLKGNPGSGKSFLLQKTIVDCLKGHFDYLPIYINLSEYDQLDDSIIQLISDKFYNRNYDSLLVFRRIAENQNILLLLDGFDEISDKTKKLTGNHSFYCKIYQKLIE
ncbi:MAG: NACHT domain-containing protein [Bacteroidota bacterium]